MILHVKVKKLDPSAILPTFGSDVAAGADLFALTEKELKIDPGKTEFVRTGLAMEIPFGYMGLIFARSGLSCKRDLAPANKVGVIDSDYRGEIMIALHNHGNTVQTIIPGERIAQIIVLPIPQINFTETNELDETKRGIGGFGSTGRK